MLHKPDFDRSETSACVGYFLLQASIVDSKHNVKEAKEIPTNPLIFNGSCLANTPANTANAQQSYSHT